MNAKKYNAKITKVEEPSIVYEDAKAKLKGIETIPFDFDAEFKNGYTPEEFKAEMHKRIKSYPWEK